ncbi:AraC family transcriptional regulator, L-rhamnose operon regulatory protein RhaS [Mariniphaga anaerophila]|uniref:AraC family transcriptional regulator, L-rhamnose operon regulatory protein RhaS n=1 Tax=Mariniphaga anaerophila TaxID=1484053 RepID=A0A1M4UDD6_9BACT|nr:AraC family transcriptional regulator [Mariniphaga anaerophila]SHE54871.1 AraC family transcriptional regulator, L-rhamnose operon regulatory protein RhaS [Mariniphaga anaerophila]
MNSIIPKYYDPIEKRTYEADSCVPLRQAWANNELELTSLARGTYPGGKLQNNELEGVKSVGCWNIKKLQNWGLEWHTNEGIEISFLENGSLDFLLKDCLIGIQTNDITITRPWIIHKLGNPNVDLSKLYWLILDVNVRHPHQQWEWPDWIILNPKDLDELTLKLRQNEQPVLKANREFKNCFIEIGRIIKQENKNKYDSRLKVQINNLLILLLEILNEGNIILDQSLIESRRTVELFLHLLESKTDEGWTVVKMAEYCHLGATRFTHYCKEITNCSPMEYLNKLRLRRAAKLLGEIPSTPVIDVAYMCGFSSPQYFNFAFKKHFKVSPNSYRKEKLKSCN